MRVFGLSRDSPYSHRAFAHALDLDDEACVLLSDWEGDAVRALGLGHNFEGMSDVSRRAGLLVDGDGVVRETWSFDTGEVPDLDVLVAAARRLGGR